MVLPVDKFMKIKSRERVRPFGDDDYEGHPDRPRVNHHGNVVNEIPRSQQKTWRSTRDASVAQPRKGRSKNSTKKS